MPGCARSAVSSLFTDALLPCGGVLAAGSYLPTRRGLAQSGPELEENLERGGIQRPRLVLPSQTN